MSPAIWGTKVRTLRLGASQTKAWIAGVFSYPLFWFDFETRQQQGCTQISPSFHTCPTLLPYRKFTREVRRKSRPLFSTRFFTDTTPSQLNPCISRLDSSLISSWPPSFLHAPLEIESLGVFYFSSPPPSGFEFLSCFRFDRRGVKKYLGDPTVHPRGFKSQKYNEHQYSNVSKRGQPSPVYNVV